MTSLTAYMGVDPGLSGAIAVLNDGELEVFDVPTFNVTRNKGLRREIDVVQLANIVDDLTTRYGIRRCEFEWPNAMPKQGTASSHTFGLVTGQIHGIVVAHRVPVHRVQPFVWKRHYGLNADKDAARRKASSVLPRHAHNWPLVKHDGRAEAALLAVYAAKLESQELMS